MSLPVLFLLVIVTAICALRRRRRTARGLAAVSLALVIAIGCGPVPAWLLDSLEGPFEARPAVTWANAMPSCCWAPARGASRAESSRAFSPIRA